MMTLPQPSTRTSSEKPCGCSVCTIAKAKDPEIETVLRELFGPSPSATHTATPPVQTIMRQCMKCLTYIGKGRPHICSRATKRSNLEGVVKSSSSKSKSRVVAAGIKNVFGEAGVSTKGGRLQFVTGGTPLTVTLGAKAVMKKPRWSHDSLIRLQTKNNLSDKTLL